MSSAIGTRKLKHIEVCLQHNVNHAMTTGLETVAWPYHALPELALADISLHTQFFGKPLAAPILIGAMTGGAELAGRINTNLAIAAQTLGLGLMLGSQRIMLEDNAALPSFLVRQHAPDALVIGNLGVGQLNKGYGLDQAKRAVELVKADGLAFHTNPLQEAVQPGGDTDFRGLVAKLEGIVPNLDFPVLLKEVGHGLSGQVAKAVQHVGFAALDVAGAGGTNWAKVEQIAHHGEVTHPELVEVGLPTKQALLECRAALPQMPLVASGGIRSGLDVAKCLILGANVVAMARPLLAPAIESPEAVIAVLQKTMLELHLALFVAGFANVTKARGL